MKRTVITLVGLSVLMFFPFVSCVDKLLDDNKGSEGNTEESPYRTLQDSSFYYRDGKLQHAFYSFYDSIGNCVKALNLYYDNEGNLIMNVETTYSYEENKRVIYSYYNYYGLKDDVKYVCERSGSGINYIETYKYYAYHEDNWILTYEGFSQRDNNMNVNTQLQYALYNGEMIVVKRSKTKQTYNSVSGAQSLYETENYNKSCLYSNLVYSLSSSDFGIIGSIIGETWNKSTTRYDERGNTVENIRLTSNDSITWNESKSKSDYRYDSFGNMIEAINKENDIYTNKHTWSFDNKNRLLKEVYSVWSESESDFVVDYSIKHIYSKAGILAAAELYSKSRNIRLPQMKKTDIVNGEWVRERFSISYASGGMSNNAGTKCTITCDSNGNPASEFLYRLDSEGNLEEIGRCSLVYNSNGTNYSYVVEMLENGDWIETEKSQRTASFDANGNQLNSYSYLYSKSTNNYGFYSFSVQESESRQENRYNELGYISYSSSSSISNTCYVYSDGREEKSSSESKYEYYYTTIKVR